MNAVPWKEMRRLDEKLTGLRVAVEGMRKDVAYLSQFYVPLTLLGLTGLLVGLIALFIAMDNRALMLKGQQEVVQEIQQQGQEQGK